MSVEKEDTPKTDHPINGCILLNNIVYIPLNEIVKLLKKFSLYNGKHFALLLEEAEKQLLQDQAKVKELEKKQIDQPKSFFAKVFGQ